MDEFEVEGCIPMEKVHMETGTSSDGGGCLGLSFQGTSLEGPRLKSVGIWADAGC